MNINMAEWSRNENKYQPEEDYTFFRLVIYSKSFMKPLNRIIIVLPLLAPVQQPSAVTTWKSYDFCTRMSENA